MLRRRQSIARLWNLHHTPGTGSTLFNDRRTDLPADRSGAGAEAPPPEPRTQARQDGDDLTEMLQEMRVLIPGVQVLTGFLLILPFSQNFRGISLAEKWVFLAAFVCGLISLILLSAPAAQLRIERPLRERARFKDYTTRMTIIGLMPLSLALILTTQLVVEHTLGQGIAFVATGCVAILVATVWWIWPLTRRRAPRAF